MTVTTRGQIQSCPDYCKTEENVNINLCESLIVYILLSTCHMTLAVNRPDIPTDVSTKKIYSMNGVR